MSTSAHTNAIHLRKRGAGMPLTITLRRVALAAMSAGLFVLPADAHALSSCTYEAISQAVVAGGAHRIDCDGTISFPQAIVVPAGTNVRLDASGSAVTFDGRGLNRLFEVDGILTLVDLTLANGRALGATGSAGTPGTVGTTGADGANGQVSIDASPSLPPEPGGGGGRGTDGTAGGAGTAGRGGAVLVRAGGQLGVWGGAIRTSTARGGRGGSGGAGGAGGQAGRGGHGGGYPGYDTQTGGSGGLGGIGGTGATAGAGGSGEGGAIYNLGNVFLNGAALLANVAQGGQGGTGGASGAGGMGGAGGAGGFGGDFGNSGGGAGGTGGGAGSGGVPGNGGLGAGAAIAGTGAVTMLNTRIEQNRAIGGAPGSYATANPGGTGGTGGTGAPADLAVVSPPGYGGAGGDGGPGASHGVGARGGPAVGAGVYFSGTARLLMTDIRLLNNRAIGASSGTGGPGGRGGAGGLGGTGGPSGDPHYPDGDGGRGGDGGPGGNGGTPGRSGDARGGGISSSPAVIELGAWTPGGNTVTSLPPSSTGSAGGTGGAAGAGGPEGATAGNPGPAGAAGAPGSDLGATSAPNIDGATLSTPQLQLGPAGLPAAIAANPYAATFTALGGTAPYVFRALGLPPGVVANATTGQITGTPTRAGVYLVQLYVRDTSLGDPMYGGRTLTLVVAPKLIALSPAAGPPGTLVTIMGAGFTPGSTVTFGTAAPVAATDITPTSLKAIVPAGTGRVAVSVLSNGARSARVTYQYSAARADAGGAGR